MGAAIAGLVLILSRIGWEVWYQRHAPVPPGRWHFHAQFGFVGAAMIAAGAQLYLLAGLLLFAGVAVSAVGLILAARRKRA